MSLLSNLFGVRASVEGPYRLNSDETLSIFSPQRTTVAGMAVNESNAMTHTTVFACVKVIAEAISSLPLIVYERMGDDGRRRLANDEPLAKLLRYDPNPNMSSMVWRETMLLHLLLWGNHYSRIRFTGGGDIKAVYPLDPRYVTVETARVGKKLQVLYRVTDPKTGEEEILRPEEVFHPLGLSQDGLKGMSVIASQRETIGLGMALNQFGSSFFGNGARPGGILSLKNPLKKEQKQKLKESWEEAHQGPSNFQKVAVLDGEMAYIPITISPEDAQFLESRKFSVEEIARMYRVPLVLLQSTEKSTSWGSGIEQLMIAFVTHTLRPWMVRVEHEISRKLIPAADRDRLYAEHLDAALLRGDLESRYKAYAIGRQWGWLSPNDVRKWENMDPIDGEEGDSYQMPQNITGAPSAGDGASDGKKDPPPEEKKGAERSEEVRAIIEPICRRQFSLLAEREVKALRKGLEGRDAGLFLAWADDYYKNYGKFVRDIAGEAILAAVRWKSGGSGGEADCDAIVQRIVDDSHMAVRAAVRGSVDRGLDSRSAVTLLIDAWETVKAEHMLQVTMDGSVGGAGQ